MKIGPKFKIARRLGAPVFEKTQSPKYAASASKKAKKSGPKQRTDFGIQMAEKQKARYTYLLTEKQFSNYVKKALAKKGSSSELLLSQLESRLDNAVLRAGFATARGSARQMVSHNHITVNGKIANIPSYALSIGDVIGIRAGSLPKPLFKDIETRLQGKTAPSWIKVDFTKKTAEVQGVPKPETAELLFDVNSVIEFYSR